MDALGDSLAALENWYYGQITRGEPLYPPEYGKVLTSAVTLGRGAPHAAKLQLFRLLRRDRRAGYPGEREAVKMLNNDHKNFAAAQALRRCRRQL